MEKFRKTSESFIINLKKELYIEKWGGGKGSCQQRLYDMPKLLEHHILYWRDQNGCLRGKKKKLNKNEK